ncbi:MAG: hypothetical protein EAZ97_03390 [Bacteroidetes bacterium]|nr:MAG: hypothetical protein EAZ97_03390 [Bacteroidota bacterium]
MRTSKNSEEFVIYGSSRLGTYSPVYNVFVNQFFGITANTLTLGYKAYELSNHLGNVLTTISDNYYAQNSTAEVAARVLSSQDYFPFGMVMTERSFQEKQERKYRWGFNTQEKDEDIDEGGSHYTAEFWEYDGRIGRRWNVDPVVKPWESSYMCLGNNPISLNDVKGDDAGEGNPNQRSLTKQEIGILLGNDGVDKFVLLAKLAKESQTILIVANAKDIIEHVKTIKPTKDGKEHPLKENIKELSKVKDITISKGILNINLKDKDDDISIPVPLASIKIKSGNSLDLNEIKVEDKTLPEHIDEKTKLPVIVKHITGKLKITGIVPKIGFIGIPIKELDLESKVVKNKGKDGKSFYTYDITTRLAGEQTLGFKHIPKKKNEK